MMKHHVRQTRRAVVLTCVFLLVVVWTLWPPRDDHNPGDARHPQRPQHSGGMAEGVDTRGAFNRLEDGRHDGRAQIKYPTFAPAPAHMAERGGGGDAEAPNNNIIHVGGMPDDNNNDREGGDGEVGGGDTKHVVVKFLMSNSMSSGWRSSSKRLSFPTQIEVRLPGGGDGAIKRKTTTAGTATLYGKSSLKIKYTRRRSIHVRFDTPIKLDHEGPELSNVVLLSLWEDKYRLAYRSSADLLNQLGVFHAYAKLVELRCDAIDVGAAAAAGGDASQGNVCDGGNSFGAYLLLEYPSDAIVRHATSELHRPVQRVCESDAAFGVRQATLERSVVGGASADGAQVEVGTRNWFYFERPKKYDILHVPSYSRNSTLSKIYAAVEKDPVHWALHPAGAAGKTSSGAEEFPNAPRFDLNAYLTWIAVNSVLMNGDYDDEVFFYKMQGGGGGRRGGVLSIMAWDYDTVFAPCHRKEAVPSRMMYCAETPIERHIATQPVLAAMYREVLSCVLHQAATPANWEKMVRHSLDELTTIMASSSAAAKSTFDDVRDPPNVRHGADELIAKLVDRRATLLAVLPAAAAAGGGDASGEEDATAMAQPSADDHHPKPKVVNAAVGEASACSDATSLKRQIGPRLKKAVPREHKAGRGSMTISGLPLASIEVLFPIQAAFPDVKVAVLSGATQTTLALDTPGMYCAKMTHNCTSSSAAGGRVVWFQPFVLRSKQRGAAEFGVPHYDKPAPASLVVPFAATSAAAASLAMMVSVPTKWIMGAWFPVVLRLTTGGGSTWLRRNVAVELMVEGNVVGETVLVRGFSAVRFAQRNDWTQEKDGPLLAYTPSHVSGAAPMQVRLQGHAEVQAKAIQPPVLVDVSSVEPLPSFDGITRLLGDQCVLVIEGIMTLERGQSLTIGAGCLMVFKEGATLNVLGELRIEGTALQPVVITGTGDDQQWVGILVRGEAAVLTVSHAFVTGSGVKGKLTPSTGKHHKHSATITAVQRATVTVSHTFFLGLSGPAFAAGTHGTIRVTHSVVQWAELGIECVQCDFFTKGSTWSNFPTWDAAYEDDDNDAMYLSGGVHRVVDSVVAHTKDDCIDSGTPEKSTGGDVGGSLLVDNTILEMCQHEAIALSSSPKAQRSVRLSRLWIEHAQQGIESGYTGRQHVAEISDTYVARTLVALRFGDNYYNRPQLGQLKATGLVLELNNVNALNYVREIGGPQFTSAFKVDAAASHIYLDTRTRLLQQQAEGGNAKYLEFCEGAFAAVKPNVAQPHQEESDARRDAMKAASEHVVIEG